MQNVTKLSGITSEVSYFLNTILVRFGIHDILNIRLGMNRQDGFA